MGPKRGCKCLKAPRRSRQKTKNRDASARWAAPGLHRALAHRSGVRCLVSIGITTGTASADREERRGEPEIFVPHATFRFDDGYDRTREGHYYHYVRDGRHYGRDHREGVR